MYSGKLFDIDNVDIFGFDILLMEIVDIGYELVIIFLFYVYSGHAVVMLMMGLEVSILYKVLSMRFSLLLVAGGETENHVQ